MFRPKSKCPLAAGSAALPLAIGALGVLRLCYTCSRRWQGARAAPPARGEGMRIYTPKGEQWSRWEGATPVVILAGSFNPLHKGHTDMAEAARKKVNAAGVCFELAVKNADKGGIAEEEIQKRVRQFAGKYPVAVTSNTLFIDKARAFPGAWFVMGYDTVTRFLDPKYYGDAGVEGQLREIADLGCRLVVAGRHDDAGIFRTLSPSAVPKGFEDMFVVLSEAEFAENISSTELRRQGIVPT